MPANMTFKEAAAVCNGVIDALTCLRLVGLGKGQRILVYGASGSVGTAAVQLARYFDAHVTAVCNTKNVEIVRSLGADEVIDYTKEDFTRNGETYDVILDAVGKHSFRRCRDLARRDQEGETPLCASPGPEEGRLVTEGAHRGGEIPGGHRSVLPLAAGRRREPVCRDGAEDGECRPDDQPRPLVATADVVGGSARCHRLDSRSR